VHSMERAAVEAPQCPAARADLRALEVPASRPAHCDASMLHNRQERPPVSFCQFGSGDGSSAIRKLAQTAFGEMADNTGSSQKFNPALWILPLQAIFVVQAAEGGR
jgi:hypothetical protein